MSILPKRWILISGPMWPYVMTISRTTVDKLGIKLYDKASAVVSELIANAYDADAETVTVEIPLGRWLATKSEGKIVDQGLEIIIKDSRCDQ